MESFRTEYPNLDTLDDLRTWDGLSCFRVVETRRCRWSMGICGPHTPAFKTITGEAAGAQKVNQDDPGSPSSLSTATQPRSSGIAAQIPNFEGVQVSIILGVLRQMAAPPARWALREATQLHLSEVSPLLDNFSQSAYQVGIYS